MLKNDISHSNIEASQHFFFSPLHSEAHAVDLQVEGAEI